MLVTHWAQDLPAEEITSALSWLTTSVFREMRLPALAVILADSSHEDLLQHLAVECRQIDRESDQILIMSPGVGDKHPEIFNPLWHHMGVDELSIRIKRVRSNLRTGRYNSGTRWGSFSDAALRLLDLEKTCLPALYLRFSKQVSNFKESCAVVVPLSNLQPKMASRLLKQLSWAATDHADGVKHIDEFLREHQMFGWLISESTQAALDKVLDPRRIPSISLDSTEPEHERVQMVFESTVANSTYSDYSDMISAAKKYFVTSRDRSPTAFNRPDLIVGLELAAIAQKMGDFATTVRNIAAAIESIFTASLIHLVRGEHNIRLPSYLDHVDPDAGPVEIFGVSLNRPRKESIGVSGGLHPWLAPSLSLGSQLFEQYFRKLAPPSLNRSLCAEITSLINLVASLRNSPAHGGAVELDRAQKAWQAFETFLLSGQAFAMATIRNNFRVWPTLDWNVFACIRADPRPRYEQAMQDYKNADSAYQQAEKQNEILRHGLRVEIRNLESITKQIKFSLERTNLSLTGLLSLWSQIGHVWREDVFANLQAATESDRRAKSLAKSTSRWFIPTKGANGCLLEEFFRLLFPTPILLELGQKERVLERLEALLATGVCVSKRETWREEIRHQFNVWLDTIPISNAAKDWLFSFCQKEKAVYGSEDPVFVIANGLIDEIKLKLVRVQSLADAPNEALVESRKVYDCAGLRLTAARAGEDCECRCGRHVSK